MHGLCCCCHSTGPTELWHPDWPSSHSEQMAVLTTHSRTHLLRPTKNLNCVNTLFILLIRYLTSSNFGTCPGCIIQKDEAVNVVPTSIETIIFLSDPLYGALWFFSESAILRGRDAKSTAKLRLEREQCDRDKTCKRPSAASNSDGEDRLSIRLELHIDQKATSTALKS
jgi:hypothetical protein